MANYLDHRQPNDRLRRRFVQDTRYKKVYENCVLNQQLNQTGFDLQDSCYNLAIPHSLYLKSASVIY